MVWLCAGCQAARACACARAGAARTTAHVARLSMCEPRRRRVAALGGSGRCLRRSGSMTVAASGRSQLPCAPMPHVPRPPTPAQTLRRESPRIGGNFANWGLMFSVFDCSCMYVRQKVRGTNEACGVNQVPQQRACLRCAHEWLRREQGG